MEEAWRKASSCSDKYQACCDKAPLFHPENLYACEEDYDATHFIYHYDEADTKRKCAFIKLSSILPPGDIHAIVIGKEDVRKMKNIEILIGGQTVMELSESMLRAKDHDINIIKPFCEYLFGPSSYAYHELCIYIQFYDEYIETVITGEQRVFKYENYDHECDDNGGYTDSAFDTVQVANHTIPKFDLKFTLKEYKGSKVVYINQWKRVVEKMGIYRMHDVGMMCQIVMIPDDREKSIQLETDSFQCEFHFNGESMYTLDLPKRKVRIDYMDFHITNCADVFIVYGNKLHCVDNMCSLCFSI
jgi:hypothetical protein